MPHAREPGYEPIGGDVKGTGGCKTVFEVVIRDPRIRESEKYELDVRDASGGATDCVYGGGASWEDGEARAIVHCKEDEDGRCKECYVRAKITLYRLDTDVFTEVASTTRSFYCRKERRL